MIFSGTARRMGQMRPRLPWERICAQYGFRFFDREKSKSVASTVKRQRGFAKGKARFPFTLFCFLLQEQKEGPRGERC